MSLSPASWRARLGSVVVTGGSRGLGLGVARRLVADGYQVIALARQAGDQLGAAMAEFEQGSGSLHFLPADLADIAALPALAKRLRQEFGPIAGLVNNAGIGPSGLLATMPDAQIEAVLRLNVLSPVTLTKYLVRSMMADGGGRIVSVASIVAASGHSGLAAYAASKAAMVGFTRSLAREVGQLGITVNAVAPGFVDTELTHGLTAPQREQVTRRSALRRMAEVQDVAAAVAYLFSEGGRNVSGTVLTVDAGTTA